MNKKNNIIEYQNMKNSKNNDSIKDEIKYDNDKSKIFIQKQNFSFKNNKINKNSNFIKSFSTKIIKSNKGNNALNNKIKEGKVNNNDLGIQIKKACDNNEEKNNKEKELFYITMPNKFTKIQNTLSNYRRPKINFSNISYLNDTLFKNSKYNQGTQTNDTSSRIFTSNFLSINNESSLRNRKNEKIVKINQINGLKKYKNFSNNKKEKKERKNLANEVLKPSFLRSDVTSTFLNYYHSNPISNKNKNNNRNLLHILFE